MAGLPLKSGADFYNLEAARLRLHNLGADPTEVGAGLIYFNTSTGLNTSQKARLYTGSAWKTIAFSEDLDVASNADFLALKDKVDTLIGDGVDMDGIIESWKEVEAFLSGMSDTKSLMDLLNDKLSLSQGGTIESLLLLQYTNPRIAFKSDANTTLGAVGFKDGVLSANITADNKWYALLHSGNVGEYALKTDGSNEMTGALLLNHTNPRIAFMAGGKTYGSLGYFADGLKWYVNSENAYHAIAFTDSNVASATKLETARTIWGQSFDGTGDVSGALHLGTGTIRSSKSGTDLVFLDFGSQGDPYIGYGMAGAGIDSHLCGNTIYLHYGTSRANGLILNSSGNVTIGASDLAQEYYKLAVGGSTYLLASKGTSEQPSLGNIGTGTHVLIGTDSYGLEMWSRSNGNFGMQVHRFDGTATAYNLNLQPLGGNVLIGTTEDNGSGAKLQVNGGIGTSSEVFLNHNKSIRMKGSNGTNYNVLFTSGTDLHIGYDSPAIRFGNAKMFINSSGNVGIGTTEDNGAKLNVAGRIEARGSITTKDRLEVYGSQPYIDFHHGNSTEDYTTRLIEQTKGTLKLVGDLHVTGNIIADGEVSAGGAAEEGGNAGGGGAFYSDIIKEGATQTTIAHGLGTDDIVVSIYEKDGVSGRWSIILTDVEIVDANNIIVSFGSATTVEHKVVIMGAVA